MVEATWLAVNGRYGHTEYMCNHCYYLAESPYSVCHSCKRKMINGIKVIRGELKDIGYSSGDCKEKLHSDAIVLLR